MILVGIETSPLKTGHAARGIGSYTRNLLEAFEELETTKRGVKIEILKKRKKNYGLVHYPYFDLFFLTLPLVKKYKTVVTIHDVIPLIFPRHYPPGAKGKIKFSIQRFSLQSVEAVITDSQNSKNDIVKYLGYPEEKIYVVYLAPGDNFKPRNLTILQRRNIVRRYGLPERFVLYVGDVNYNKNVEGLIRAFSLLEQNPKVKTQNLKLVLVGKAFQEETFEMHRIIQLIRQTKLEEKVMMTGFIPEEDLVLVYNLATVYCQPSFYEGFGLPVLEAMACGCPVLAANTSSLPEICGKAALMFDPENENDLIQKIGQVTKDFSLRKKLIKEGLFQVKKFSWLKTAKKTIDVYEKVVLG